MSSDMQFVQTSLREWRPQISVREVLPFAYSPESNVIAKERMVGNKVMISIRAKESEHCSFYSEGMITLNETGSSGKDGNQSDRGAGWGIVKDRMRAA